MKIFYKFEEKGNNKNSFWEDLKFQAKLFYKMNNLYFSRTPESDSLYRRRNRLVILASSCLFYYKTSKDIFGRFEIKLFAAQNVLRKLLIPLGKSVYFFACILLCQLVIKYIYFLNKVYKSHQFALESVLKYNLLKKDFEYRGDFDNYSNFDIVDSHNIKKNQ